MTFKQLNDKIKTQFNLMQQEQLFLENLSVEELQGLLSKT